MDNLKQLISDLSDYWEMSPEKVVDRLNFMNESEINKIVNKMINKFRTGGVIDCLRNGGRTYAECKKCGGRMPIKALNGAAAPATYWDRIAQQNGFESAADVAEWQKAVGLTADGKFGKQSAAKLAEIKQSTIPGTYNPLLPGGGLQDIDYNSNIPEPLEPGWTTRPEPEPAPVRNNTAYWDNIARQNGFANSAEVLEWQRQNGLTADGKFGQQSAAKMAELKGSAPINRRTDGAVIPSIAAPAVMQSAGATLAGFAPQGAAEEELVEEPILSPRYSRDDALDAGQDMGFSRRQARTAYRNMKNGLREQGLRGRELRQAARGNMVGAAENYQANNQYSMPTLSGGPAPKLNIGNPFLGTPASIKSEEDMVNNYIGGSRNFDTAFGRARKSGLKEFTWKGKRYNTQLAPATKPAATATPAATTKPAASAPAITTTMGSYSPGTITGAAYDWLYGLGAGMRK